MLSCSVGASSCHTEAALRVESLFLEFIRFNFLGVVGSMGRAPMYSSELLDFDSWGLTRASQSQSRESLVADFLFRT